VKNGVHTCGPFHSASVALYGLSENLYQQRLLSEAIDMYNEYELKVKDAIKNSEDSEYIESLQKESEYYDQLFEISLANVVTLYEA
jgi:hypothetical protein